MKAFFDYCKIIFLAFVLAVSVTGLFCVGVQLLNCLFPAETLPVESIVYVTNTVHTGYTDADLVRVMGEGALIGYRLAKSEQARIVTDHPVFKAGLFTNLTWTNGTYLIGITNCTTITKPEGVK